jgi:hypothetical protein
METPSLLGNLSINTIHKFILYMGSVIFILSLFLETKSIEVAHVRNSALAFIVIGLILWTLENIFDSILAYNSRESSRISESDMEELARNLTVSWYIAVVILLFIGFSIALT